MVIFVSVTYEWYADLGRTPDFLPMDFSQNNTHLSISYWKTIDDLEAFARRPVHIKAFKYLVKAQTGEKPYETGVLVSISNSPISGTND